MYRLHYRYKIMYAGNRTYNLQGRFYNPLTFTGKSSHFSFSLGKPLKNDSMFLSVQTIFYTFIRDEGYKNQIFRRHFFVNNCVFVLVGCNPRKP